MTKNDFATICGELLIDIGIALDDLKLCALLADNQSVSDVRDYMINNF